MNFAGEYSGSCTVGGKLTEISGGAGGQSNITFAQYLTASINGYAATTIVGAPVALTSSVLPGDAPTPTYAWTFDHSANVAIKEWMPTTTSATAKPLVAADLAKAALPTFWWLQGGSQTINFTVTSGSATANAPVVSENVVIPTFKFSGSGGTVGVDDTAYAPNWYIHCGINTYGSQGWVASYSDAQLPSGYSGTWQYIQTISTETDTLSPPPPYLTYTLHGITFPALDCGGSSDWHYVPDQNGALDDSPRQPINPFNNSTNIVSATFGASFTDWLMFTPSYASGPISGAMEVPIMKLSWSFSGSAANGPSSYTSTGISSPQSQSGSVTHQYPTWASNITSGTF